MGRSLVFRIIPARAGFTSRGGEAPTAATDHPRSRGVYIPMSPCRDGGGGSSPLARGLRPERRIRQSSDRIIPARAGFTSPAVPRSGSARDHPRSRGVYASSATVGCFLTGSSPLARGLRRSRPPLGLRPGIIPARAGFTARRLRGREAGADHPRSRGVYGPSRNSCHAQFGSSPLARGLPR